VAVYGSNIAVSIKSGTVNFPKLFLNTGARSNAKEGARALTGPSINYTEGHNSDIYLQRAMIRHIGDKGVPADIQSAAGGLAPFGQGGNSPRHIKFFSGPRPLDQMGNTLNYRVTVITNRSNVSQLEHVPIFLRFLVDISCMV